MMNIDDVIRRMAVSTDAEADEAALREFTMAAARVDGDPGEAERIRVLAESVDAEILAYDQGLAALDCGDTDAAEALLLQAVSAELGDADQFLPGLLRRAPGGATPLDLRQRAAEARAHRAILNAAYRHENQAGTWRGLVRRISMTPKAAPVVTAEDLAEVLMTAMEAKDPYTRHHSERISQLVMLIGRQRGMRPERIEAARLGGLFHDIGKLAIPNTVLLKSEALTEEEYTTIQLHAMRGVQIVRDLPEFFEGSAGRKAHRRLAAETLAGIMHHHERFDGSGYPMGLAGQDIPEVARAIAVADAFDALTTARSYRPRRSVPDALAELRRSAGRVFDPEMVEAFLAVIDTDADQIDEITRHAAGGDHARGAPVGRRDRG
jgi:HD-GYP domain-containing protein (c-di-GMP phosphodiesterase class II)